MAEYGLGQFQGLDFATPYLRGVQAGQESRLNEIRAQAGIQELELNKAKLEQSHALQKLKLKAADGDPGAARIVSALDPEYGKQLQEYQQKKAVYYGTQAKSIAKLPLAMRNDAYNNLYEKAKAAGEDVSMFPIPDGEWSDIKQSALDYIANSAIEPEKQLELEDKDRKYALDREKFGFEKQKFNLEKEKANLEIQAKKQELAGQKPLSGEAAKLAIIGEGGSTAVRDLRSLLANNNINALGASSALTPNVLKGDATQKFDVLRTDLQDQIGRLRSGGQISENEQKTYEKLIPKFGDSKNTVDYKIKRLEKIFGGLEQKVTGKSTENKVAEDPLGLFK